MGCRIKVLNRTHFKFDESPNESAPSYAHINYIIIIHSKWDTNGRDAIWTPKKYKSRK